MRQTLMGKTTLFSSVTLLLLCFWLLTFGCCLLLSNEVVTALCQISSSHHR
jgi:hypothetical protein